MIHKFTLILERLLLPLALFIFVSALGISKTIEPDTFWHIKAGELIVKNISIPRTDPFTFTLEREPWVDSEWLSQIIFFSLHALGGLPLLTVFKAIIIAAAYLALYVYWRHSPIVSFSLILCIALASRLTFYERPQIFTFLFLSIFVIIIERYKDGKSDNLLTLPLLMIPWANLHPGFIFGLILYAVILFSEAAKLGISTLAGSTPGKTMTYQRFKFFSAFFLLTGIATFINGTTYHVYFFLFSHVAIVTKENGHISEFLPLSFSDSSTFFPLLLLIILSVLIVIGILLNRKNADISSILPVIAFAIPALWMRRFVTEFFIVSLSALIRTFRAVPAPQKNLRAMHVLRPVVLFLLFLLPVPLYLHLQKTDFYHFLGLGIHRQFFPSGAIGFIEKEGIEGNMYNSQSYGGVLIYTMYPQRKVFIDTRYICYERLLPRVTKAMQDAVTLDMFLSIYKVDSALVESERRSGFFIKGLFPKDTWALVYWDDLSEIFVRRTKKYAGIIHSHEYIMTNSETILSSSDLSSPDPERRSSVEKELERVLKINPNVSKAWYALGILHGNSEQAISELKRALDVEPSFPEAHQALARIYHVTGNPDAALAHYADALTLNVAFGAKESQIAALYNEMGALCLAKGSPSCAAKYLEKAEKMDPTNQLIRQNLKAIGSIKGK